MPVAGVGTAVFETVVIATDGSESVDRGVAVALDLAERFDAAAHALFVAAGTRGRHGSHGYLIGSVAEGLLRTCDPPVLTVRQLEGDGEHAA